MKKEKGFLGPIGDDIPSLIPIIFSLVIFFAAFNQATVVYNSTKSNFGIVSDTLQVSNSFRGTRYITSHQEFRDLCNRVSVRGFYFKAGLVELEEHFEPIDIFDFVNENQGIYSENDELFACPLDVEREIGEHSNTMVNMFPVVYEDNEAVSGLAVRPMLLVVVVWH